MTTNHSDTIVHATDASFKQSLLDAPGPVLVDFWAEWCGPCKALAPLLDEAASAYQGRITVAKINVDENPMTPVRMGVRSLPTLLILRNGKVERQHVGVLSRSELRAFIESSLV
jgi:thioredoxin 1